MKAFALPVLIALAISGGADADTNTHDVFGAFLTDEGSARIEITDCGDGSPCGHFVWFNPNDPPRVKATRAFSEQQGKPLLGALMLQGFSRRKSDWRGGRVFDSDNNKVYAARLKRLPDGSLQVKGCIGPFCQTQVWPEAE